MLTLKQHPRFSPGTPIFAAAVFPSLGRRGPRLSYRTLRPKILNLPFDLSFIPTTLLAPLVVLSPPAGRPAFLQVLHVVNHVLSMLMQTGDRGLPAALQANDPTAFEGGEGALLRCVEELVACIRISERDTLARLICRCGWCWRYFGVG